MVHLLGLCYGYLSKDMPSNTLHGCWRYMRVQRKNKH